MKKTKIIATIGPNSCSKEVLREFILNGLDVVRINLSHATYDFCIKVFKTIKLSSIRKSGIAMKYCFSVSRVFILFLI